MERRRFLQGILLAASAPAIVRFDSLMPMQRVWTSRNPLLRGELGEWSNVRLIIQAADGTLNTVLTQIPRFQDGWTRCMLSKMDLGARIRKAEFIDYSPDVSPTLSMARSDDEQILFAEPPRIRRPG